MKIFDRQLLKCLYDNFILWDKQNVISVTSLMSKGLIIDNKPYTYEDIWGNMQEYVRIGIFDKIKVDNYWYYILSISKERLEKYIKKVENKKNNTIDNNKSLFLIEKV